MSQNSTFRYLTSKNENTSTQSDKKNIPRHILEQVANFKDKKNYITSLRAKELIRKGKNQTGISNVRKQKEYNTDRILRGNVIQKSYTQPRYHSKTTYLQWKKIVSFTCQA